MIEIMMGYITCDGDYPWYDLTNQIDCRTNRRVTLYGDYNMWWVFNDKGNIHTETSGDPIGMEIKAQAFAFATNDEVNSMTFYNYELINRSYYTLNNTYFAVWVDSDIGCSEDDYVGCDVQEDLAINIMQMLMMMVVNMLFKAIHQPLE